MPTREQIVACARSYLGTRWQHQARLKGVACDCAGLVIGVGSELFGIRPDVPPYGHTPHARTLERTVGRYMREISVAQIAPGDVVLMAWDGEPHHMGIVTSIDGELGLIHAYARMRRVVEHRIDAQWRGRIRAAYSFPDI